MQSNIAPFVLMCLYYGVARPSRRLLWLKEGFCTWKSPSIAEYQCSSTEIKHQKNEISISISLREKLGERLRRNKNRQIAQRQIGEHQQESTWHNKYDMSL